MILVDSLLYKIDQRLNKLASNEHQSIQLEDKILILNDAQLKLIQQKVDGQSTNSGIGLEGFKKRYEDIQNLIEPYEDHKIELKLSNSFLNEWSGYIESISPKYMFYIDSYVIASKGRCKNRIIYVNNDLVKHSDLTTLLKNSNYKPSFEYQETFNTLGKDLISVYTDGTFTPSYLYLSYLRYPKYIDKKGYIKFDGTESVTENCELNEYLENELIDLAVQNIAMYIENQSAIQTSQMRIATNE